MRRTIIKITDTIINFIDSDALKTVSIWLVILSAVYFTPIVIATCIKPIPANHLSSEDVTVIEHGLAQRNVHGQKKHPGDCAIDRTGYGFSCTEIKSGKVFKVARKD